jgi:hypothetical protein
VLGALPKTLRSFSCNYYWLCNSSVLLDGHLEKLSSLSSLAVMNMFPGDRQDILSSLLTLNRRSLRHLKLRYTPIASTYVFGDPLLPVLRALGESGEPLRLHTLEMYLLGHPDVSWWRQAFDFRSMQKVALVQETRVVEETLVSHLLGQSSSLKSLRANFDTIPLLDFVEQSSGLEELLIHQHSWDFVEQLPSLSGHFKTLRALFLPVMPSIYYYREPNLRHLRMVITNCTNLEQLAVPVSAHSRVSTRLYPLANSQ